MYLVEADRANRRVIVAFSGMYDHDLDQFDRDLQAAASAIRTVSPYFDLLVDFREAPVMSKDTAETSTRPIAWCLENGLRKSANVTSSAIMKMQIQRVAADPRFRYFTSREAAAAWLDSAD